MDTEKEDRTETTEPPNNDNTNAMERMSREAKDPRTRTWAEANGPEDSIKNPANSM